MPFDLTDKTTLADLAAHENKDEVIDALMATDHPVVKGLRSRSFSVGKSEGGKGGKTMQETIDRLTAELREATEQAAAATGKAPNKDEIEAPLLKRIERLQREKEAEVQARDARIRTLREDRDLAEFKKLVQGQLDPETRRKVKIEHELDPMYVDVVAERAWAKAHRYTDKDELEVLDEDGVPYTPEKGEPAYAPLARTLNKAAPPQWIVSNADSGAGVRGAGGALGGGASRASIIDQKRNDPRYQSAGL